MENGEDNNTTKRAGGGLGRREVLRLGGLAGLSVSAGWSGAGQVRAEEVADTAGGMPVVDIAPLGEISPGSEVAFDYPDENSPAMLVRLDGPAQDGIGPGESIVAFSLLCTHKGCPVSFYADRGMMVCPCHWSSFDPAKAGRIIIGQASEPLPQITLRINDGVVQAVGVSGLIYGRHTNIL